MSQEDADLTAGGLLLATAFSWGLYGCIIVQFYIYYTSLGTNKTSPKDPMWLRSIVGILCILETGFTMAMTHSVWVRVVNWYTVSALQYGPGPWTSALCPVFSSLVASIVQIFLARRIRNLSGVPRDLKSNIVVLIIILLALAEEFSALCSTAKGYLDPQREVDISGSTTAYLVLALVCDMIIASTMVTLLLRAKTTITGALSSIMRGLIFKSFNTGVVITVAASLALFLSLHNSSTRLYMIL
ncbi:hypothetical protein AX16_001273 [Volvariella volvacea WC 439]|nr:hypothetical protein AX16_001273 [Volvariella volvacea WC 439]